jgi:subtilisin-like proprotein convertase family protein
MAVVVASGNDGTSNALSAPACASSAVSVGAVYSQTSSSQTWLDDMGATQCVDAPTAPDQIVCFSDSASNLSMLAPGAFWVVAKKGSGVNTFAGTSAAAPAAAGSVAALRQLRPALSPGAIGDVLRATGTPLTDPRNALVTPRIDLLGAITLDPNSFFSAAQSALPATIPDGSESGSVPIMVSGPTGTVSGLQVLVEIDHPDPDQLLVTLHAPNGVAVVLHDQTGQHEHPINAIYGKIDEPAESLGAFQGGPVAGLWTLTVEDTQADVPTHAGRIVNFGLLMTSSVTSTRSVGARAAHEHQTRTVAARRGGRPGSSATALSAPAEATAPAPAPRPRPDGPDRIEPER